MIYIFVTLVSGFISGVLSIYFRILELKKEIILMPRQLVTQIALFAICAFVFREFFTNISIDLNFIELNWFLIYILFSSFSYYLVQVFYEYFSGNTLFATEAEMKKYIEKLERDKF